MWWTKLARPLNLILMINCKCVIHGINLHRILVQRLPEVISAFLKHINFLTLVQTLFKSRFFINYLCSSIKRLNSVLSERLQFRIVNHAVFY